MSVTARKLFQPALLTDETLSYYTVASGVTIIKKLTFTNASAAARTVSLYLVPSTQAPSTTNILISGRSLAIGETWECFPAEGHTLAVGDSIQASCSAKVSINIQASGVEIS